MSNANETRSAGREQAGRITPHRPVKVQVCLTPQERQLLSHNARAEGFETLSAFVRARTLGGHEHA